VLEKVKELGIEISNYSEQLRNKIVKKPKKTVPKTEE
jgi:hypothetical protein